MQNKTFEVQFIETYHRVITYTLKAPDEQAAIDKAEAMQQGDRLERNKKQSKLNFEQYEFDTVTEIKTPKR